MAWDLRDAEFFPKSQDLGGVNSACSLESCNIPSFPFLQVLMCFLSFRRMIIGESTSKGRGEGGMATAAIVTELFLNFPFLGCIFPRKQGAF